MFLKQRRGSGVHDGVAHRSQAREPFPLRATRRQVSATAVQPMLAHAMYHHLPTQALP